MMKKKNVLLSILPLTLLLSACQTVIDQKTIKKNPSQPFELTIAHINDHHSHLDEEKVKLPFDVGQGKESISINRGGIARVATMMKTIDASNANVIKIHAGDAITGDLYFNLNQGLADAAAMNQICFDSFTLGNHEFDAKDAGVQFFLNALQQGHCKTAMQILSANVIFGPSSEMYGTQQVKKSAIIERNGEKIGLVGITIAAKTKNASQPNADTIFTDEVSTAQTEINQLKAQGVNKIILQSHVGYDLDLKIAQQLTDVDVIIGGDSHTLLGPDSLKTIGLNPVGAYPTVTKNKHGDRVCIAQAWQYNYAVGELKVKFDSAGRVTDCGGSLHILLGEEMKHTEKSQNELTPLEKNKIKQYIASNNLPLSFVNLDPHMQATLQPYQVQKQQFVDKIVGYAQENFCSQARPNNTPRANCRGYGGDIQQFVAQAMLQQAKKHFAADISIQNGGGVRIEIPQGPINVATVYQLLPFKNTLVQLTMTGQEVKAALEDAIEGSNTDMGAYPYSGGLRWQVDMRKSKGQRLSSLEVKNAWGQYQALDLNKTYQVATLDFLARGSNYYTTLKGIQGERRKDIALDYADIFLNYLADQQRIKPNQTITRVERSDYSTQQYITE